MLQARDDGATIDRFFDALARGDLPAIGDCMTEDVRVWHGFDRIFHDRAAMLAEWEGFIGAFVERIVRDVRRQATATGFVQQHIMEVRSATGRHVAWPVCVVFTMRGDRIALLEEYIDRAGYFEPADA